jgi:predicted AlkP superfamily pyrophosphatase or phosphodiesterase
MAALSLVARWRRRRAAAAALAFGVLVTGIGLPAHPGAGLSAAQSASAVVTSTGSGGINAPAHLTKPSLVLISLDGFRADYFDRADVPNVARVLRNGTRARALVPVFPSLTFPNHYSLVTGLRPDRHGIVANSFFDSARNETYSMGLPATVGDGSWYGGEPIWVTAERQGMVTACYFWPGSEAAIGGIRPTIWTRYDGSVANDVRVDTVLEWLRLPDQRRPKLITLYISDVDGASHRHELGSDDIDAAIRAVDRALGRLLDGIETLAVRDRLFLVVTSDHGMADTQLDRVVALDDLVDMGLVRLAEDGPVGNVHVHDAARVREVRDRLNRGLGARGRAYLRAEVPARLHYRASPRIGDIVVIMNEGYVIETAERRKRRTRLEPFGTHGWDPALPAMRAVFAVAGPGIRVGATVPEVDNIDVYPFLTELLGLRPARGIDGRPGRISKLVMDETPRR